MRIAFFVGSFPVVSETFILRQITGLLDLGHDVDIYAERRPDQDSPIHPEVERYNLLRRTVYTDAGMPEPTGYWQLPVWPITGQTWVPGADRPIPNAVRVLRAIPAAVRCLMVAPRTTLEVVNPQEYGYQAESLSALYRLAAICTRSRSYDVLHAHFGPQGNTFRFARSLWKAPFVVSFHGYDYSSFPREQGTHVYKQLFDTADGVTVNSEYTRGRVEMLGCPSNKLHKLPVGLNPAEYPFRERRHTPGAPIRILTVARLVEIKGIEYAIRSVARVRETHPDLRYDIVGDGPLREQLDALARELGVGDCVGFHGARDGAYVRQMMEQADLFMLSSVSIQGDEEGQGLVLQEAQASGLPVIATDHGAFREGILHQRSGFLVPERDVGSLAGRLAYLLEHPERWPELGREGRAYVEANYDIRTLNRRLVEIYRSLIDRRRFAPVHDADSPRSGRAGARMEHGARE